MSLTAAANTDPRIAAWKKEILTRMRGADGLLPGQRLAKENPA